MSGDKESAAAPIEVGRTYRVEFRPEIAKLLRGIIDTSEAIARALDERREKEAEARR